MKDNPITTSWLTPEQRQQAIEQLNWPAEGTWLWSYAKDRWNWPTINDPTNHAEKEWANILHHIKDNDARLNIMYLLSDDPQSLPFIHRLMQANVQEYKRFVYPQFISLLGNFARQYPETFLDWYKDLDSEFRVFTTRIAGKSGNPDGYKKRPHTVLKDILWLQKTLRGKVSPAAATLYTDAGYTSAEQMDVLAQWFDEQKQHVVDVEYQQLWDRWIEDQRKKIYKWLDPLPVHPGFNDAKEQWLKEQTLPDIDNITSVVSNPLERNCNTESFKSSPCYFFRKEIDEILQFVNPLSLAKIDMHIFQWLPKTTAAWLQQVKPTETLSGKPQYKLENRIALLNAYVLQQNQGHAIPLNSTPHIFGLNECRETPFIHAISSIQPWAYIQPEGKIELLKTLIAKHINYKKITINLQDEFVNSATTTILRIFDHAPKNVEDVLMQRSNRELQVALLCLQTMHKNATWDDLDQTLERARVYQHMDMDIDWSVVLQLTNIAPAIAIESSTLDDFMLK